MRKIAVNLVVILLALAAPAVAADLSGWLVVVNSDNQTCYRLTAMPQGANWHKLAQLNTFREAGAWIWEHRTGECPKSPVFG